MYVERQSLIAGDKLALNSEYKIIEEIGKGTSSIVYLAEDCSNSRLVLIKELYPKTSVFSEIRTTHLSYRQAQTITLKYTKAICVKQ